MHHVMRMYFDKQSKTSIFHIQNSRRRQGHHLHQRAQSKVQRENRPELLQVHPRDQAKFGARNCHLISPTCRRIRRILAKISCILCNVIFRSKYELSVRLALF